jgi:hypothetical protein
MNIAWWSNLISKSGGLQSMNPYIFDFLVLHFGGQELWTPTGAALKNFYICFTTRGHFCRSLEYIRNISILSHIAFFLRKPLHNYICPVASYSRLFVQFFLYSILMTSFSWCLFGIWKAKVWLVSWIMICSIFILNKNQLILFFLRELKTNYFFFVL